MVSVVSVLMRMETVCRLCTIGLGSSILISRPASSPIGCYDSLYTECALSILPSPTSGSVVCCSAGICPRGFTSCVASSDLSVSCDEACSANSQIALW